MKENQIHVEHDGKAPLYIPNSNGDVVIREGKAVTLIDPKKPKKIALVGVIQAPADFVDKRSTTFDEKYAHVVANYTDRTIVLVINESDLDPQFCIEGGTVTGKIELYPILDYLQINGRKEYSHRDLFDSLKFLGRFFENKEAHQALLKSLTHFNAKVNTKLKDENDFSGKAAIEVLQEIEHEIPLSFVMNMPIFGNTDASKFKVDIRLAGRGSSVYFWLESVELDELTEAKTISLFEAQLLRLKNYAIIKQW